MLSQSEMRWGVESRRSEILEKVRLERQVRTEDLAEFFGVSVMTIHRDLDFLAGIGKVEKFRGGARANDGGFGERDVSVRRATNTAIKRALAGEVGTLIRHGDVVALDDSTTVEACLGDVIAAGAAGIITHSLPLMTQISKSAPHILLTGVGGRYVAATDSFLGSATCRAVDKLFASISVVSTTCITAGAIYHPDEDAAITKASFTKLGERRVLVTDSSKFDNVGMHFVANLKDFDDIIIDSNLTEEQRAMVEDSGASLHLVDTAEPEPTHPTPSVLK